MVDYVISLVAAYGYLAVFFFLMVGILGLPIPDEVLMSYVGVIVAQGKLALLPAVAAAWLGSCCGVTVSYVLGRTLGHALLVRLHGSPEKAERVRLWFDRRGRWALVVGYFMPGFRHITSIVAGSTQLGYHHFALFAYPGALLWACTYIFLGYFLGMRWFQMSQRMHLALFLVSAAVVAAVALFFLIRRRRSSPPEFP